MNDLSNKAACVADLLNTFKVHVFGIGETLLNGNVPSSFVSILGYDITKWNNSDNIRTHEVVVYLKLGLKYKVVACRVHN